MKRRLTVLLTLLALTGELLSGGMAHAGRSGGGFGGSRSGGFGAPRPAPRVTVPRPRITLPRATPPHTTYRAPAARPTPALPSAASVRNSAANRAAAARVSAAQLANWKSAPLPAGVPRTALTYSAVRSAGYPYALAPGHYYPYPQNYYRQHHIGADLLRYAVIYTAVSGVTGAAASAPARNSPAQTTGGDLSDVPAGEVSEPQRRGPNLWAYAGVGLLAAAAGWFTLGRRRERRR